MPISKSDKEDYTNMPSGDPVNPTEFTTNPFDEDGDDFHLFHDDPVAEEEKRFDNTLSGNQTEKNQSGSNSYTEKKDDSHLFTTIPSTETYVNTPGGKPVDPTEFTTNPYDEDGGDFHLFHDAPPVKEQKVEKIKNESVVKQPEVQQSHSKEKPVRNSVVTPGGSHSEQSEKEEEVLINGKTPVGEEDRLKQIQENNKKNTLKKKSALNEEEDISTTPYGSRLKLPPEEEANLMSSENKVKPKAHKPAKQKVDPIKAKSWDQFFYAFESEVSEAQGFLYDSPQYKKFKINVHGCRSIAGALYNSIKKGKNYVRVSALDDAAQAFLDHDIRIVDGKISLEDTQKLLIKAYKKLQKHAEDYIEYKDNQLLTDPKHKKLNSADRTKLELMNKILPEEKRWDFNKKGPQKNINFLKD